MKFFYADMYILQLIFLSILGSTINAGNFENSSKYEFVFSGIIRPSICLLKVMSLALELCSLN